MEPYLTSIQQEDLSREQFIQRHLPLVTFIANGLAGVTAAAGIEREDAIGYGIEGLIKAVDRYDRFRGVAFSTYAAQLIRGAIIDAIRRQDFMPRPLRSKVRIVESAILELANQHGRWPSMREVAFRCGLSVQEVQWLVDRGKLHPVSLEQTRSGSNIPLETELEDGDDTVSPSARMDRIAALEPLKEAVSCLSVGDARILDMHYRRGMSFKAIGQELLLSTSGVSRIHSRILRQLRRRLGDMDRGSVAS